MYTYASHDNIQDARADLQELVQSERHTLNTSTFSARLRARMTARMVRIFDAEWVAAGYALTMLNDPERYPYYLAHANRQISKLIAQQPAYGNDKARNRFIKKVWKTTHHAFHACMQQASINPEETERNNVCPLVPYLDQADADQTIAKRMYECAAARKLVHYYFHICP